MEMSSQISSSIKREKRHQVSRACVPCARSKRKCDGDRPCKRCVDKGCISDCVDVVTKRQRERQQTTTIGTSASVSSQYVVSNISNTQNAFINTPTFPAGVSNSYGVASPFGSVPSAPNNQHYPVNTAVQPANMGWGHSVGYPFGFPNCVVSRQLAAVNAASALATMHSSPHISPAQLTPSAAAGSVRHHSRMQTSAFPHAPIFVDGYPMMLPQQQQWVYRDPLVTGNISPISMGNIAWAPTSEPLPAVSLDSQSIYNGTSSVRSDASMPATQNEVPAGCTYSFGTTDGSRQASGSVDSVSPKRRKIDQHDLGNVNPVVPPLTFTTAAVDTVTGPAPIDNAQETLSFANTANDESTASIYDFSNGMSEQPTVLVSQRIEPHMSGVSFDEDRLRSMMNQCLYTTLRASPLPCVRITYDELTQAPTSMFFNKAACQFFGVTPARMRVILQNAREFVWVPPDELETRCLNTYLSTACRRMVRTLYRGRYLHCLTPHAENDSEPCSVHRFKIMSATAVNEFDWHPEAGALSRTMYFLQAEDTKTDCTIDPREKLWRKVVDRVKELSSEEFVRLTGYYDNKKAVLDGCSGLRLPLEDGPSSLHESTALTKRSSYKNNCDKLTTSGIIQSGHNVPWVAESGSGTHLGTAFWLPELQDRTEIGDFQQSKAIDNFMPDIHLADSPLSASVNEDHEHSSSGSLRLEPVSPVIESNEATSIAGCNFDIEHSQDYVLLRFYNVNVGDNLMPMDRLSSTLGVAGAKVVTSEDGKHINNILIPNV